MTTATILARMSVQETLPAIMGSIPKFQAMIDFNLNLSDGTDANQFDLVYMAERTVNDGANDDIDLIGSLVSALGQNFDAAEIVGLMIVNRPRTAAANTTDLTVGAGTNAWEGLLGATGAVGPLKPGSCFLAIAGDAAGIGAVVAASEDILRVANSAGADNTYQIGILGRSA